MKASLLIIELAKVIDKYGDLEIIGGQLHDDTPLREVSVLEKEGGEIWPNNVNGMEEKDIVVDGIWLSH